MTHTEKRIFLIQELLEEDDRYQGIEIPEKEEGQKNLLRSLMNMRIPKPVSNAFLRIQNEYLCTERDRAGIVDGDLLPAIPSDKRIVLWKGDITALKVDAIVNAANNQLRGCFHPLHACVDNIIHSRSGVQLRLLCDEIMKKQGDDEPAGRAKITLAFNLPSKYILHTVGPIIYDRVAERDCDLLSSCYRSCLALAVENNCKSVAFCCISTGEFHFPNERAARIAIETVREFQGNNKKIDRVIFNVFKENDLTIYKELLGVR